MGTGQKGERLLSARGVAALANKPGRHSDGGGLYLEVSAGRRSWIWRYRIGERRRDMGLGSAAGTSLAEARAERDRWRAILKTGLDPIEERERQRAGARGAANSVPTFGEVADDYIEAKTPQWKNAKHAGAWRMTLLEYAKPLRGKPIDKIAVDDILATLRPIWHSKPETAARLRGRIEAVIDAARARGHIEEGRANPARWRGHLDKLLPKMKGIARGHHAAMPFDEVPAFVKQLRAMQTIGARALEFTILTAVRMGESIGATWDEIDFEAMVWTIPKVRMKAGLEYRVPLTPRAVELLREMQQVRRSGFIFPGRAPGQPMSDTAFDKILRHMDLEITTHGFRSSFRDWAGEVTNFPRELAEAALAHAVGDKTEKAYRRGDALERRRVLMDAWEAHIEGSGGKNVILLRSPKAS